MLGGFDSMRGLPLCLVPGDRTAFLSLFRLPPGGGGGEFVEPAQCAGCVLESRCFGLRRGYAQMYGWDELRPMTVPSEPDRALDLSPALP